MAEYIPFVTSEETARLVQRVYHDAEFVRVPIDREQSAAPVRAIPKVKLWVDPAVDGLDDLRARQNGQWFSFISSYPYYEKIASPEFQLKPVEAHVDVFAKSILDKCLQLRPAWITVPQIPFRDSGRNKINRALARATAKWKSGGQFSGKLILPLIFTHQDQVNKKKARNSRVEQAQKCYQDARADGFWVVERSLQDDSGSSTLKRRFAGIVALHQELNEKISSAIRIAGPYWGLNLVLWARGLVDHPAIGVGSGYQYFLAGGPARPANVRIALASLRRRAGIGPRFKLWLDGAIDVLSPSHRAHAELSALRKNTAALAATDAAREQVARFYSHWADLIAAAPRAGRSMALFQDLSAAYALGKSLPELTNEGTARRPESVAEYLMLSCL